MAIWPMPLRIATAGGRVLRRAPGPLAGVLPDALGRLDAKTLRGGVHAAPDLSNGNVATLPEAVEGALNMPQSA
jgi:hypothetical protein